MNAEDYRETNEAGLRLEEHSAAPGPGAADRPVASDHPTTRAAPPSRKTSVVRPGLAALLVIATMLSIGGYLATRGGRPDEAAAAGHAEPPTQGGQDAIPVKAIRPRRDPNYQVSVEQPAYVEAYYTADLQARVAGPIIFLDVDIGDR